MSQGKVEQRNNSTKKEILKMASLPALISVALAGMAIWAITELPTAQERADMAARQDAELDAKVAQKLQEAQALLESKGVWGSHPLRDLQGATDFSVQGGFFLGFGSVDGNSTPSTQFAWGLPDGRFILSQLESDKIYIEDQEEGQGPTITIHYDLNQFNTNSYNLPGLLPVGDLRDLGNDPHAYVNDETVISATVRLNEMSVQP